MNQEEEVSFPLRGMEKVMVAENIRIAHVLHTSLSSSDTTTTTSLEELLDRAPIAWKWVTTRHPRMRARLSETTPPTATVYPTLSESALAASLVILKDDTSWKDYVLQECHKTRPHLDTKETLFSMTLLPNAKENKLVLVIFSDHVLSDGFSGYVILRDFLHILTKTAPNPSDAAYFEEVPTPLPLQKPMFEQVKPRTYRRRMYDKFLAGMSIRAFSIFAPYMKTIFPKTPRLSTDKNCTQHFASGSAENLKKALEICRSEQTTLFGPICIAIALSLAQATDNIQPNTKHIKMMAGVDYNLRNRVGMGKEHVGMNIGISNPMVFTSPGLKLEAPFWETARRLKRTITKAGDDTAFHASFALTEHVPMDRIHALGDKSPHGIVSDVNISNLGRWPFGSTIGGLSLDEVYLYHQIHPQGGLATATVFFVTSIHSLQYAMTSMMDDTTTMDAIFHTVVQIVESVPSIGPTTTLREVLQNVTPKSQTEQPTS